MGINTLQQNAFVIVGEFQQQVSSITIREATYLKQNNDLSERTSQDVTSVIKAPNNYSFVQTMVAESTWNTGFDAWAADPEALDGQIGASLKRLWPILVGPVTDVDGNPITWV
jgi:hypothetical protein